MQVEDYLKKAKRRRIHRTKLEDLQGAETVAHTLDHWVQIAQSYQDLLNDEEHVSRCLTTAESLGATAVDDINGHHDVHVWWTLANAHFRITGNLDNVRACLETGFERVEDSRGCVTLALAWDCYREEFDEPKAVRRCLRKGERLADTVQRWVQVAEGYFDNVAKPGTHIRRCLKKASSLIRTPQDRRLIADAYRYWLGDAKNADRFAPSGQSPKSLFKRRQTCPGWTPDPSGLFDTLRDQITQDHITAIASADYGNDLEKHLPPLRAIIDSGCIPHPLDWYPLETLQLSHWSTTKSSLERAFCASLLILDEVGPEANVHDDIGTTVSILLPCCQDLGPTYVEQMVGLLVACAESRDPAFPVENQFFVYLGILLGALQLNPQDPRLENMTERITRFAQILETRSATTGMVWEPDQVGVFRHVLMIESGIARWLELAGQIRNAMSANPSLGYLSQILTCMGLE